jgi:hypothetical protein
MSVLDGSSPLTPAQNSGGLSSADAFNAKKHGEKTRLFSFGKRHIPIDMAFDSYFGSISGPITSLEKFLRDTHKEKMKREGRTGLTGMFRQFFNTTLPKKIFGVALDPQLTALQQIRDVLIKVHDPKGENGLKKEFTKDVGDTFTMAIDAAMGMWKTSSKDSILGKLGDITKRTIKAGKEGVSEQREMLDAHLVKTGLMKENKDTFQKTIGVSFKDMFKFKKKETDTQEKQLESIKEIKDTSKSALISQEAHLDEAKKEYKLAAKSESRDAKQDKEAKFDEDTKRPEKVKRKTSMLMKALGVTALLGALWGKKGVIAGLAGTFFVSTLPMLMLSAMGSVVKGLASLAWGGVKMAGSAVASAGGGMAQLGGGMLSGIKGALFGAPAKKRQLGSLKKASKLSRVGRFAGRAGTPLMLAAMSGKMVEGDWNASQAKYGDSMGTGGHVGNAMLGDTRTSGGWGRAGNAAKQSAKWGLGGAAIGTAIMPGLGTAVGAGVGAVGGGISAIMKSLFDGGIIQPYLKMMNDNKFGTVAGALLGGGVLSVPFAIGGAYAQDRLRDPEVREKIMKAMVNGYEKITGAIGKATKWAGDKAAAGNALMFKAVNDAQKWVGDVWDKATGGVEAALSWWKNTSFKDMGIQIKDKFKQVVDGIVEGFVSVYDDAAAWFKSMGTKEFWGFEDKQKTDLRSYAEKLKGHTSNSQADIAYRDKMMRDNNITKTQMDHMIVEELKSIKKETKKTAENTDPEKNKYKGAMQIKYGDKTIYQAATSDAPSDGN